MKRLLLIPLLLSLCSCWDYTEPSAQNYVLGFSVDYVDGLYDVCIETVKVTGEPESLSASEGVIIESRGVSIFDAVRDAITLAGKKLYWGHTEVVILSEVVARDHLYSVIDLISRSPDVYSNISLVMSRDCLARDVINANPPGGSMVSVYISNIIENEETSHRFKSLEVWQLKCDFPYTLIPAVSIDKDLLIDGCGIIFDGGFTGYLSGEEVQIVSLLQRTSSGGYLPQIAVEDASLSLEILRTKTISTGDICRVNMVVALANSNSFVDTETVISRDKIERAAERVVKRQIDALQSKSFGKILSYATYDVHITLESTGLKKG